MNSAALKIIFTLIKVYLGVAFMMFLLQREFIYLPITETVAPPERYHLSAFQEVHFNTADGLTLFSWYAKATDPSKPTIVYFHGNGGTILHRISKANLFINKGYGVLLVEYRGYAHNPGSPSEDGFYMDAKAALDFMASQGITPAQMVLYGESLGTGVAIEMARRTPNLKALILEAPYTSIVDVAQIKFWWLPVHLLLKDRFESLDKIRDLKIPTLILHGRLDPIIPYHMGETIYNASPSLQKKFIRFDDGLHNNLYDFQDVFGIFPWLDSLSDISATSEISP